MMTDFRALCEELLQAMDEISEYEVVDWSWVKSKPLKMASESMKEARAALDEPVEEGRSSDGGYEAGTMWTGHPTAPPVAEEVAELVVWLEAQAIVYGDYLQSRSGSKRLTRAATLLLQQQHLMSLCATEVESLMEQQTTPVVPQKEENREFVLKEMKAEDGSSLGWYVNHSDFYCDIQKEDGVWGIYFRDKITDQDAYGEPNETND
jgi:hypothetical protein